MTEHVTQKQRVVQLASKLGIISRADVREADLPEESLSRLEEEDKLTALAPGVYMAHDHDASEFLELAVVAEKAPNAVLFGISALQFHALTTQVAHTVQIAIERGRWTPQLEWPTLETFHISGEAFSAGVEHHTIEKSVELKVYSVAKTVADLFKFRNTLGLDVAIEALREGWREQRFTMDELYAQAKICRVQTVMRPYLEMLQ